MPPRSTTATSRPDPLGCSISRRRVFASDDRRSRRCALHGWRPPRRHRRAEEPRPEVVSGGLHVPRLAPRDGGERRQRIRAGFVSGLSSRRAARAVRGCQGERPETMGRGGPGRNRCTADAPAKSGKLEGGAAAWQRAWRVRGFEIVQRLHTRTWADMSTSVSRRHQSAGDRLGAAQERGWHPAEYVTSSRSARCCSATPTNTANTRIAPCWTSADPTNQLLPPGRSSQEGSRSRRHLPRTAAAGARRARFLAFPRPANAIGPHTASAIGRAHGGPHDGR